MRNGPRRADGIPSVELFAADPAKDKKSGQVIRRERCADSLRSSFYVGEYVSAEDIKGKPAHGVLTLWIPKKEEKPKLPEKKTVDIEG